MLERFKEFFTRLQIWLWSLPWWASLLLVPVFVIWLILVVLSALLMHGLLPIALKGRLLVSLVLWIVIPYAIWKAKRPSPRRKQIQG